MLRQQPRNAGQIAATFSVSRPAVSRHLRVLREAGLVTDELVGRERAYRLELDALGELEAFLARLRAPNKWERRLAALGTEVARVKHRRRRATRSVVLQYSEKESA